MALDNAAVNSRLVIILMIIVGLISAVGVIISAVALGRPSVPDISINSNNHPIALDWLQQNLGGSSSISKRDLSKFNMKFKPQEHQAKSVWTVALGNDNGAHDYRSEDGTIQGFGHDMVDAVCATMGIECRVVYDRYQNCWTSTAGHYSSGGQGLLGQWYDACIGWAPTRDRMNVFEFSPSYTDLAVSKVYVKSGNQLKISDIMQKAIDTSMKIGFVNGFMEDEQCLSKNEKHLAKDLTVYADTPEELVQMLNDNKVAAIFSNDDALAPYLNKGDIVAIKGAQYTCASDGYAAMTRKDSTFLPLWNEGFDKLKKSGAFNNLCDDADKVHGFRGSIKCNED